jgi:hypothetical protein
MVDDCTQERHVTLESTVYSGTIWTSCDSTWTGTVKERLLDLDSSLMRGRRFEPMWKLDLNLVMELKGATKPL